MEFVTCGSWHGLLGQGLAERELQCLLAVAAGHTDKEIARRDGLSPRSIKGRIESVMFKLNIHRRPALVAEAIRLGLIAFAGNMPPAPKHHNNQDSTNGVFIA